MFVVNWVIVVEINNDFFIIEMFLNGKVWKSMGEVKGVGNFDVEFIYEWKNDEVNVIGMVYVWLK